MNISSTLVIGAGGTGGHLIPLLARLLTYHPAASGPITIYDGDAFEPHNAERQPCSIEAAGLPKAEWMRQLCAQQGLEVQAQASYVNSSTLRRFLRQADGTPLIIASVDNDATRKMCLDILEEAGSDFFFVTPGNAGADDPLQAIRGNVLWYGRVAGQTYGINPALVFPNIETPQDAIPRDGGCMLQQASSPQLVTANALAATLTLAVVQNILDDQLPQGGSSVFFNGRSFTLSAS